MPPVLAIALNYNQACNWLKIKVASRVGPGLGWQARNEVNLELQLEMQTEVEVASLSCSDPANRMLVIIFRFLALDAKLYACLDNIIALAALAKTARCAVQTCLWLGKGGWDGTER